ncbi:hypothetical protein CV102_09160 [Natronococcus pandeyae]|uniref:DUF8159 domain-containing protein n=1 Tax=Natronococcus pandeyae TaxID=2055836 RepID=A0A8J8TQA7_9EURY|nr:hypothetical protein [Natronococcus pandeyae]TYL38676.1 hypothetical protein CV102_09160 [Natronococcus pandeyae]
MTSEPPVGVALENRLMSNGIYVTDVAWLDDDPAADDLPRDGTGLTLTYETVSESAAVTSDEVSAVVRTLLSVAEEREWTPGRLEVTSRTTDGALRGRWHVEEEWFAGLGTELSEIEFSQRVLETVDNVSVDT